MTVWIARVSLVLALVLGIALGVQSYRLSRLRDREFAARAAVQREQLLAAGWKATATASQAELARIVPALEAQIAALRRTNATLAGTSHWTGHGAEVPVPCTVTMWTPGDHTASTAAVSPTTRPPEPTPTVAVTPHVLIDDAVALDDAGGIYVARHVQARLSVGEAWASEWGTVTADPGGTTAVDPEVSAAWKAYRNPPPRVAFVRSPKQWRFGLACGIGLGYGVVAQGVDVTAACVYGVEF